MPELRLPSADATPPPSPMPVATTGQEIRERLQRYDRSPFIDVLANFVEQAPSVEAIKQLAEKSPDKYAVAMSTLARVAGFTDRTEQTTNINVNVRNMSDSQIEDQLRQLMGELDVVDVEFSDVQEAIEAPVAHNAGSDEEPSECD